MKRYESKYSRFVTEEPSESRWAEQSEIENSSTRIELSKGKLSTAGLPLISDGDTTYVNGGDDHTIIFGSTGSKKTRCLVLPMIHMMLRAGESVVCTDPKGEIFANTANIAKRLRYDVIVLNFRDFSKGDGYNPLSEIYDAYHSDHRDEAMEQIDDFISAISAEDRKSHSDPFWTKTASQLGVANMNFLMETASKEEANISNFTRLCLEDNYMQMEELSRRMSSETIAGMNYRCVYGEPERTRQSTQATLTGMVQPFLSNVRLQNMLSETTFDMKTIGTKKTIVYIILSDEKPTYYFLVTLFIKQLEERLIRVAQHSFDGKLPVRVNYMLDEFGSVPRIEGFESAITAARSRNIRFYLILQSQGQLKDKYGNSAAEIIKGNCTDWVFLTSKELPLLNEISELCGSRHGRALISPSELQRLKKTREHIEALILNGRNYPFFAKLLDISQYRSFINTEPADMPERKFGRFKALDISEIFFKINTGQMPCPFVPDKPEDIKTNNFDPRLKVTSLDDLFNSIDDEDKNDFDNSNDCFKNEIDNEEYKLQKELEKKFDELFGTAEDADEED